MAIRAILIVVRKAIVRYLESWTRLTHFMQVFPFHIPADRFQGRGYRKGRLI